MRWAFTNTVACPYVCRVQNGSVLKLQWSDKNVHGPIWTEEVPTSAAPWRRGEPSTDAQPSSFQNHISSNGCNLKHDTKAKAVSTCSKKKKILRPPGSPSLKKSQIHRSTYFFWGMIIKWSLIKRWMPLTEIKSNSVSAEVLITFTVIHSVKS